jgi:hypothetical protein
LERKRSASSHKARQSHSASAARAGLIAEIAGTNGRTQAWFGVPGKERSDHCEAVPARSLHLVNPGDTKRVQDKFVVQTQLGWIENGLPCTQNLEVLRYAPELMMFDALTIFAGEFGGVSVAISPRIRLSGGHGRSFLLPMRGRNG